MRIDLHMHTTCSDGELSPKEIIDEAVNNKVDVISITDHDTFEAYTDELLDYAKEKGIKIIRGVEVSTKYKGCNIHVLGYNFDLNNKEFKDILDFLRNARKDYFEKAVIKLKEVGYIVDYDEVSKIDVITKAHIALDIIKNGLNEKMLLEDFGYIPTIGEFIEGIMNKGCKAYVEKASITPKEAADYIRNAGGIVVLAHPVAYGYQSEITYQDICDIIDIMKPDGLETNYLYADKKGNIINEIDRWNKLAEEKGLFTTIGSDFHRKDSKRAHVGFINELGVDFSDEYKKEVLKNLNVTL